MTKGRLLAAVVLAAAVPAGCVLNENSGGYAAGAGAVAGDDHDASAADASDEGAPDGLDDAGADPPVGGNDGGGGDDGGGAAMHCSALPFGCVCAPTEPSQVGACNTGSVIKMPGQRSVCCNNPYNCICVAYECVRAGATNCACQLAAATAGTRVDDCSGVIGNAAVKCCRSYGQCVCSTLDCLPIETRVPNCSIQDLVACDVDNESVPGCEEAGARPPPS